jgi:hypothetical protein
MFEEGPAHRRAFSFSAPGREARLSQIEPDTTNRTLREIHRAARWMHLDRSSAGTV